MKQDMLSQMRIRKLENITQGHITNELWRDVPVINLKPFISDLFIILESLCQLT